MAGKARPEDRADRGVLGGGAAERDLVEFLALLVEAEDADVADVVVAAGIDAARDVDLELADLVLLLRVRELARDRLGDRDRARGGERAIVEAGAGDDVARKPVVGRGEVRRLKRLPDGEDVVLLHMRQHDVLRMADAQLVEAVALGEVGHHAHLVGRGIARNAAFGLQRDVDDGIATARWGPRLFFAQRAKAGLASFASSKAGDQRGSFSNCGGGEIGGDALRVRALPLRSMRMRALGVFGLDLRLELLGADLVHEDLDARLVLVVAAAIEIVDAHDGFEIADQLMLGQEVAHRDADHRRAAQAAADDHFPADLALRRSCAGAGRCRAPSPRRGRWARPSPRS